MLTALDIQNFVLIDQARLTLSSGLTAMTGETGAGKSILLDALGMAVGGRADRGAVRRGAKQCVIAASFDVQANHPVWPALEENALGSEGDEIILRRVLDPEGRSRGFVNDQPVSIGMLRSIGELLLEIHGQHDGRGFLSASAHRGMLDEFAGLGRKTDNVAKHWRQWRSCEDALAERRRDQQATAREADYFRHVVKILEALDPKPDEEAQLADRRAMLMASEKITADLDAAGAAIDEGQLEAKLSVALRNIERAASRLEEEASPLVDASSHLGAALQGTAEARAAIDCALQIFGGDQDELEATEERLFALRGEARKHGVTPDQLADFRAQTIRALEDLEQGEAAFSDLEKEAKASRASFDKAARALSAGRTKAAKKLDDAVMKELAPLKLDKAIFHTEIASDFDNPNSEGYDRVEFMVTTNPGAPPGPLKTIASGGELSRFVLAMKAALAAKESRTVIIFDEVDAGVGGAVADAVGERLARLASDAQVMVVTHSPQVAARADSHWRIEKAQSKSATKTSVTALTLKARIEEIARMLSGAKVSEEARAAAAQLLGVAHKKAADKKLAKAG